MHYQQPEPGTHQFIAFDPDPTIPIFTAILESVSIPYTLRGVDGQTTISVESMYFEKLLATIESTFWMIKHLRSVT